jgi:hypothetical protein
MNRIIMASAVMGQAMRQCTRQNQGFDASGRSH